MYQLTLPLKTLETLVVAYFLALAHLLPRRPAVRLVTGCLYQYEENTLEHNLVGTVFRAVHVTPRCQHLCDTVTLTGNLREAAGS